MTVRDKPSPRHLGRFSLASELWHGKSVARTLMNHQIAAEVKVTGFVVDAGGGGQPSYWRFLDRDESDLLLAVDLMPDLHPVVCGSVESLPVKGKVCDVVLCFNLLEHVFDFQRALTEIRRILKVGGSLYGYVPFLVQVHADPCDYWRFTGPALERLLRHLGFTDLMIVPLGGYFTVLAEHGLQVLRRLKPVAVLWCLGLLLLDHWCSILRPGNRERYPLGYFFSARAGALVSPEGERKT